MKTNSLISALFVSSLLALSACTPRDVKVEGTGRNGGNGGNNNNATEKTRNPLSISVGDYALTAFMAERQVEALEFIKVATQTADAGRSQISVLTSPDKEDGTKVVELTSPRQSADYAIQGETKNPEQNVFWVPRANKKLAIEYKKNGVLETLTATGTGLFSEAVSENMAVALRENTYSLKVTPLEAGQLAVTLETDGYINLTKGEMFNPIAPQGTKTMNIKYSMSLVIDQASLETSAVKIISHTSKLLYPGPEKNGAPQEYTLNLTGQNLVLNVDGQCNKLIGDLSMKTGAPSSKPMVFTFNGETISGAARNKTWVHTFAACGKRPSVDLGRLSVF